MEAIKSMSQPALRFIHASDLHLERPLGGVAEVPENLREIFLEAPFLAAEQVFETALSEGADALLLAGDVVDFDRVGPRAVVFLNEQFQRLADHGIEVYWACGDIDPSDSWPASIELPENVHVFSVGQVESFEHRRDGEVVARIQGISRSQGEAISDDGFHRDANGLFTVGVAYGTAASPGTEGDRVHYMALGGLHHRQTVDQSPGIAHYSGSPQGRTPQEAGPRGCTLVNVDDAGNVKTRFVATDQIRWLSETVEITAGTDHEALERQLIERTEKLRAKHSNCDLLVSWQVIGHGTLLYHIRRAISSPTSSESDLANSRPPYGPLQSSVTSRSRFLPIGTIRKPSEATCCDSSNNWKTSRICRCNSPIFCQKICSKIRSPSWQWSNNKTAAYSYSRHPNWGSTSWTETICRKNRKKPRMNTNEHEFFWSGPGLLRLFF